MGFWIFMLVMDLLIPVTMVFIGKRFQKKPPKEINGIYGYRTAMSMKNKETWKYAHRCCGKLCQRACNDSGYGNCFGVCFRKREQLRRECWGNCVYTAVRRYHWNDRCDRAGTEKEI